jgi:hypothetical protein
MPMMKISLGYRLRDFINFVIEMEIGYTALWMPNRVQGNANCNRILSVTTGFF